MSGESNKALVRRYFDEVWVRGDLAVLRELFVPGSLMLGAAEANVTMTRPAFSDIRATVDDLVAEGEKVAVYLVYRHQHGPVARIPANREDGCPHCALPVYLRRRSNQDNGLRERSVRPLDRPRAHPTP
jgi:hypothetical protein